MNLNELREKRGNVNKQMSDLVSKYATSGEKWSAEDNEAFKKMNEDSENLRSTIDRLETVSSYDAELKEVKTSLVGREGTKTVETTFVKPEEKQINAFRSYLSRGERINAEEQELLRALSIGGGGSSGAYAAPAQTTNEFIKILNNLTGVRRAPVRIFATNGGNDLPFPSFDDTANTGAATAEGSALATNVDPSFGQIVFKAYNRDSNIVQISEQLLQDSVIPVEQLINETLAERVAKKVNVDYTTGNGTTAPQGLVTGASASGVTLPATTLGASATAIQQNLYALVHSVAPQYRNVPSFGFMFNDSTLLYLKQLVDGQGRMLWQAGLSSAEPDRICGVPYWINPDMASIGTGNTSILVGDFSKFYIRDVNQVTVRRINELYAATRQVGFILWLRTDSKVMNSNAIKKGTHS